MNHTPPEFSIYFANEMRFLQFSPKPSRYSYFPPLPNNDCIALLALQPSHHQFIPSYRHQIHPSPEFWSACSNFAMQPIPCHAMLPTAVEISAIYNYVINFDRACCSHHILHLDGIHSPAHGSDRLSSLPIESSVLPEPVGLAAASG